MNALENGLHAFVDAVDPYFKPVEDLIASWVQWSLRHANMYVVVGIVSCLAMPFYMAFVAVYSVISFRASQRMIKGKNIQNILYVITQPGDEAK